MPTQKCCPARVIFLNYLYLSGSLEAYQCVWSSTADLSRGHISNSRHMGLCPALSQAVRFIACAQPGRDPAAQVPQGGRRLFRHSLGKPGQSVAVLTCAHLAAFCIWCEVREKRKTSSCWDEGMCYVFNCSVAKLKLCPAPQGQRDSCAWVL